MRNPWLGLIMDTWSLGMEASSVIGLRTLMFATGGPDAQTEAARMISEKMVAGMELGAMAWTGSLGLTPQDAAAKTVAHYRREVRANRRRLSR